MSGNRSVTGRSISGEAGLSRFDSVVVLSPFFWNFGDGIPGTTHYIARELARIYPTVFVEPSAQWNPGSEQFGVARVLRAVAGRRTSRVDTRLTVFHRRTLPMGRLESVRHWDLRRNARALRQVLAPMGFCRTLLWHSFPYWSEALVEAIEHDTLVYHCLDFTTREEEQRLIRQADTVFCVSEPIVDKVRPLNPHPAHLPNGVDLALFDPNHLRGAAPPEDLPIGRRLIGFVGVINRHLDIDLLVRVARAYPRDTLVVVGSVAKSEAAPTAEQMYALRILGSLPNVRLLGFRAPRTLPHYLQAFDVCLIPYVADQFNQERDPLKFYEYFAMGKTVVTTPVAIAERHRQLCHVAESAEDFVARLREALEAPQSREMEQARRAVAQNHGWQRLVEGALAKLCEHGSAQPNRGHKVKRPA